MRPATYVARTGPSGALLPPSPRTGNRGRPSLPAAGETRTTRPPKGEKKMGEQPNTKTVVVVGVVRVVVVADRRSGVLAVVVERAAPKNLTGRPTAGQPRRQSTGPAMWRQRPHARPSPESLARYAPAVIDTLEALPSPPPVCRSQPPNSRPISSTILLTCSCCPDDNHFQWYARRRDNRRTQMRVRVPKTRETLATPTRVGVE